MRVCVCILAWLLITAPVSSLQLDTPVFPETDLFSPISAAPQPVLMGPFETEYASAGKAIYTPMILKQEEPAEEASEPEILYEELYTEAAPLPDIPVFHLTAGPDGFGKAGVPTVLGTVQDIPPYVQVQWNQLQGPPAVIEDPSSVCTRFMAEEDGIYEFLLEAVNSDGTIQFDTAQFVIDLPGINHVPSAWAGPDQNIIIEDTPWVYLHGTGIDADDDQLQFTWTQVDGIPLTLLFSNTECAEFAPPAPGTYTFSLSVDDGRVVSLSDSVTVICSSQYNLPPIAEAEDIRLTDIPDTIAVSLDGSNCYDPEGMDLVWQWEQISGPAVELSSPSVENPWFIAETETDYWFRLTVDDGNQKSAPLEVSVAVENTNDETDASGCRPGGSNILFIICVMSVFLLRRKQWG